MTRTRSHAGRDAFPCLLAEEPEDPAEDGLPRLRGQIMHTEAALVRSVALLKAAQTACSEAQERLICLRHRLACDGAERLA